MERLLWYPLPIIYLRVTLNNNISITDWRYRCRYPSCPLLKTHLLLSQVGPGVKKQSFSNVPKTFQGQYWNLMKISFNIFARLKKKQQILNSFMQSTSEGTADHTTLGNRLKMLLVLNKRRKIDFERLEPSALKQNKNRIVYSSVFTTWHHLKVSFK